MAMELRAVLLPSGSYRLTSRIATGSQTFIDDLGSGTLAYSEAKAARLIDHSDGAGSITYDSSDHTMF